MKNKTILQQEYLDEMKKLKREMAKKGTAE